MADARRVRARTGRLITAHLVTGEADGDGGARTDLGTVGETPRCSHHIHASITCDGHRAGEIRATLIERDSVGARFLSACDAESSELQSVGCDFCDKHGKIELQSVRSDAGSAADKGGFLYLNDVTVNGEFREEGESFTEVGAAAVRNLLTRTALAGRWSIAVYIPDGRDSATIAGRNVSDTPPGDQPGAAAARAASAAAKATALQQRMEADARMIIRAGFKQVPETVNSHSFLYFWASPPMVEGDMMSHADALAVGILAKAEAPKPPSDMDAELLDFVLTKIASRDHVDDATLAEILTECRAKIAQGASIVGSNVLHAAAANQTTNVVVKLLDLVDDRIAAINSRDPDNNTPLMVAATAAVGQSSLYKPAPVTCCAALIGLGADKRAKDADGKTAYALAKKVTNNLEKFFRTMGIPGRPDFSALLSVVKP